MHCMDHNGVYGVIIGSVIWYLVYTTGGVPSLGTTQAQRLDKINAMLKTFYKDHPGISSRLDTLQKKNILPAATAANYVALNGPTVKAASTRHAVPFLKVLADTFLTDAANLDHLLMHELIKHTIEFNRLTYSSGTFFTEPELAAIAKAAEGVGKYIQLLRSRAKAAKQLIWHIIPKTHYMQHFPEEAKLISHRIVQCYIEESFIGKIAQIWASSKNGPYTDSIQRLALLKYLVWLAVELDL